MKVWSCIKKCLSHSDGCTPSICPTLGKICCSCKRHLLENQTGYLGGWGVQFSRWMLRAGKHSTKIFYHPFVALKERKTKKMQDRVREKGWYPRFWFAMQILRIGVVKREWPARHPNLNCASIFLCGWNWHSGCKWSAVREVAEALCQGLPFSPPTFFFRERKNQGPHSRSFHLTHFIVSSSAESHPLKISQIVNSTIFLLWSQAGPGAEFWPGCLPAMSLWTRCFIFLRLNFLIHKAG